MKRSQLWLAFAIAALLVLTPLSYRVFADSDDETFTIDVACDARTYRQNNVDPSAPGSSRGDTFIVQGKIYPGGTIPKGNNVFSPDNAGSPGTWICPGTWLGSSAGWSEEESPAFDTPQIYLRPHEPNHLFSEG